MSKPLVAVIMGSKSDLPVVEDTFKMLEQFEIPYEKHVLSAHRTPDETISLAKNAYDNGLKVIIAAAGGAAHLAGVIAGSTILPVIGIPMKSSTLNGLDSLLSTVQMPSGVPVATVAIGNAGAKNAAILAAQIIATSDESMAKRLQAYKEEMKRVVLEDMKI